MINTDMYDSIQKAATQYIHSQKDFQNGSRIHLVKNDVVTDACIKEISVIMELKYPFIVDLK